MKKLRYIYLALFITFLSSQSRIAFARQNKIKTYHSKIKKLVANKSRLIEACYQRELNKGLQFKNKSLDVFIKITPSGEVDHLGYSYNFSDYGVLCISNVIRTIKFPKNPKGKKITFKQSFRFRAP